MVEALISLSITTALLTATAAAFVAASQSVQVNGQVATATRSGRAALNHLLTEIRRADAVDVNALGTRLDVIRPAAARDPGETYRRFAFDSANQRLTIQVFTSGGGGTVFTLAENVESAVFGPTVTGTDAAGHTAVQLVPIKLAVQSGAQSLTFTGSGGPRRALAE